MLEEPAGPSASKAGDPTATGEWDMQERRSFPRTGLELPVHLTLVPNGGDSEAFVGSLTGTTRDVSRGGCALLTYTEITEITERTRCIARFPIATGNIDPDTVWAEVKRSRHHDGGMLLGLEFDTPLETLDIALEGWEAAEGYKSACELGVAEGCANHGVNLMEHGSIDKAIAAFRKAIELDANHDLAGSNLEIALAEKDTLVRLDQEIATHKKTVELTPDDASAWHSLGSALRERGLVQESSESDALRQMALDMYRCVPTEVIYPPKK